MTPVYKALLLNEPMMHDRPSCESPSSPSGQLQPVVAGVRWVED
jgi:hypothetical protein